MLSLVEEFDRMHEVANLHLKGWSATEIADQLDVPRKDVVRLTKDWQQWLKNVAESNMDVKDRIFNILFEVDQHYAMVIKEAWNTVEQTDGIGQYGNKTQALKLIASVQKDRAAMFQQAGITQETELAEQLQRTEQEHEVLKEILRDVACDDCKVEIKRKLASINSEAEVIEIERTVEE